MAKSFEAQVGDWVKSSKARMEGVFKESAQEVFAIAQKPVGAGGNMPIDTGFLRASLQTGLNGSQGVTGPESYVVAIGNATLGDSIEGGWTANYAAAVHYGARGRSAHLWAELAAQQWQSIVAGNVSRLEALIR